MIETNLRALFLIGYFLCYPFNAFAGFEDALAAYRGKDYPRAIADARQAAATGDARASFLLGAMYQGGLGVAASPAEAVAWYEKAAQGGVLGAFSRLAQIYARGDGVPRNPEKALAYARQSAQSGDPEGMFFLHVILKSGSLGYIDASGKADQAKYRQLSARPLSERGMDVEAQDALYRSSEKGYPYAVLTLALAFGGTVGDNNREHMLALAGKIPQHTHKALQNYEKLARLINGLGQSLTSPQLFFDAQGPQMLAAMLKTCGLQESKEGTRAAPPELTAIAIAKPLSGATYLPSKVPGYEHAYLVTGEWEEDWTYRGCDRTGTVRVKFSADGLGGARFFSEQTGKDIPGLAKQ
ncbi:MAG: tetratricopeptide repeat protein [Sulfuricella sp.]